MKKILVSDYDGTLYVDDINLKKNIRRINEFRKKGNIFTIATGNNYEHFIEIIKKYDIKYDYLILDQGSVIVDSNGKNIYSCFIDNDTCKNIYNEVKEKGYSFKFYNEWKEIHTADYKKVTKISIEINKLKEAKEINKLLYEKYGNKINSYVMIFSKKEIIIEIISNKTDKSTAIEKIAKIEDIPISNIYTIGNGYNDISMIEEFNGYCMEDSVPELLNECDNHVSGVSELINNLKK